MTFKEIKKTITKTKELSKIIKNHISHSFLPITLNASNQRKRETDRQRVREKATGLKTPCNSHQSYFPQKKRKREKRKNPPRSVAPYKLLKFAFHQRF